MALEPSTFVSKYRAWERSVRSERSAEVVPTPDKIAMTSMVNGTYYSTLNGRTLPLKTMLEWLAADFSKKTDRDNRGRRLCLTEVFPLNDFNFFIDLDMKEVTLDDGKLDEIVRCMIFTFVSCCAETSPNLSTIQVVVCTKVDEEGNLSCFEVETLACPCCKTGKVVDDTKTPNVQRCVQCKATWTGKNKFFTAPQKALKAWHKSGAACTNPVPVMRTSVKTAAHIRFHNARVNSQTASILAEAIRVSCIEKFPQWADRWSSFIDCAPYRSTSSDTNSLRVLFTGKGDRCTKCRGASSSSSSSSSSCSSSFSSLAAATTTTTTTRALGGGETRFSKHGGGGGGGKDEDEDDEYEQDARDNKYKGNDYDEDEEEDEEEEQEEEEEEKHGIQSIRSIQSIRGIRGIRGAAAAAATAAAASYGQQRQSAAVSCISCGGSGRVTLDKQYAIWDIYYCTVGDDAAEDGNNASGEELAHRISTNPSLNNLAEEYEQQCSKTCEQLDDLASSDALSSTALLASAAAASKSSEKATGVSVDDAGNVSAKTPADLWGAVAVVRGVCGVRGIVAQATPLYERSRTRPKTEAQFLYCLQLASINLFNGGQARQLAVATSSDYPIPVFAASIPNVLKSFERARLAKQGLELGGLTMFDVEQQRQSGGWTKRVDSQFYELIIKTIRTATGKYRRAHVCNARWSPALDCVCCFIDGPGSTYCLNVKRNHSRSRAFALIKRDGTLRMKCLSHNMPCGEWKGKVFRNILPGAIRELFGVHQSVPNDGVAVSNFATRFRRLFAIKTGNKPGRTREYLHQVNAHVRIMRSVSSSCRYTANVKPVTLDSTLGLIDTFVVDRNKGRNKERNKDHDKDHDKDDYKDGDKDDDKDDDGASAVLHGSGVRSSTPAVQVSGGLALAPSRNVPENPTRSAYFELALKALQSSSSQNKQDCGTGTTGSTGTTGTTGTAGARKIIFSLKKKQDQVQQTKEVEQISDSGSDDNEDDVYHRNEYDDNDDDSVANQTDFSESDNGDGLEDDGDEC
jgi:hypothetical protein